LSRRKLNW